MAAPRPAAKPKHESRQSLGKVLCPHCWESFSASGTLAVCEDPAFGKDTVAGEDRVPNLRFLPSRFSAQGNPIDPLGGECQQLACPVCHLGLSRVNLIARPFFISLVGAPHAGKTFLLTSAAWSLKRSLQEMGRSFYDASPLENEVLHNYGQRLFQSLDPLNPTNPEKILGMTDKDRPPNSVRVRVNGREHRLLKPFQFHYHERRLNSDGSSSSIDRVVALYDNPGQDYLAGSKHGRDSSKHLRHSRVILFVLNPLGEKRLRDQCDQNHPMVNSPTAVELRSDCRQELVLSETISRAAGLRGKSGVGRLDARIVIVVSKSDLFPEMYELIKSNDFVRHADGVRSLDEMKLKDVSLKASDRLRKHWPEIMALADSADARGRAQVFPVSVFDPDAGMQAGAEGFRITNSTVRPAWVEVPFLWSMNQMVSRPGTP